jgi:hypothetical protein
MNYYKNVTSDSLEYHPEQILIDSVLPKPQKEINQIKTDPLLSEITPPPLGIDPDKIPPRKYPPLGLMPIGSEECEKKWQQIAMVSRFASEEAMIKAKEEFLKTCQGGLGSSIIAEPEIITPTNPLSGTTSGTTGTSGSSSGTSLPNLGAFLGSLTGGANGGASAGASEQITETPKAKKPFPYWILIAGLVGGYLIFRKK